MTKDHKKTTRAQGATPERKFHNHNYAFVFSDVLKKWYRGKSKKVNNEED